eukprot:IDg12170t1
MRCAEETDEICKRRRTMMKRSEWHEPIIQSKNISLFLGMCHFSGIGSRKSDKKAPVDDLRSAMELLSVANRFWQSSLPFSRYYEFRFR